MSNVTADGYSWTAESGVRSGGFVCEGVISPPSKINVNGDKTYDAIVIGAGYAGLCAARDLASAGRSVLLVEGRDRVGGRTYTVFKDGFNFEMGGTWVYHTQTNTFRELLRYGLDRELSITRKPGYANDYFSFNFDGVKPRNLSHDEMAVMAQKGWNLFVDVDGESGRKICPLPHAQLDNIRIDRKEVEKWDAYSCWDRFQEIKDKLNEEESGLLLSTLLIISGGARDLKDFSFWDVLHAHALNGHLFENMEMIWFTYKLKAGQSRLARRMFDEAVEFGLEYTFSTHVDAVKEENNIVTVSCRDGRHFKGRKAICTVPLNMLKSLSFEPPLSPLRQEAINPGHINFMTKIHAVVEGSGMASWSGASYPNILSQVYGDGVLPSGNAHIIAFGADERDKWVPERDPEKTVEVLQQFHPMQVQKLIFHNWNTDPYSQAGPCWWGPGFMTKYQDELQARHGNVFFASADWAHGWRAFIDGALEQGFLNALTALRELRQEDKLCQGK